MPSTAPDPELDCNLCGACCSYLADWPQLTTERDRGPDGPPPELVTEDGYMRCEGDRCIALVGEVGGSTRCSIYARRPEVCRGCIPMSPSCLVARRAFGLPVPEEPSPLDALLQPSGAQRRSTRSSRSR